MRARTPGFIDVVDLDVAGVQLDLEEVAVAAHYSVGIASVIAERGAKHVDPIQGSLLVNGGVPPCDDEGGVG